MFLVLDEKQSTIHYVVFRVLKVDEIEVDKHNMDETIYESVRIISKDLKLKLKITRMKWISTELQAVNIMMYQNRLITKLVT